MSEPWVNTHAVFVRFRDDSLQIGPLIRPWRSLKDAKFIVPFGAPVNNMPSMQIKTDRIVRTLFDDGYDDEFLNPYEEDDYRKDAQQAVYGALGVPPEVLEGRAHDHMER